MNRADAVHFAPHRSRSAREIVNTRRPLYRVILAAVLILIPSLSKAFPDGFKLYLGMQKPGDWYIGRGEECMVRRIDSAAYGLPPATDGIDQYDDTFSYPGPWEGQWCPKVVTIVEGFGLVRDIRATNSIVNIPWQASIVMQDGTDFSGTTGLRAEVTDIPDEEHWTISYEYRTNYYLSGSQPLDVQNFRDLCPTPDQYYSWTNSDAASMHIPNTDTNSNGEVVFASGTFHRERNLIVSTSDTGGSNSIEGTFVLKYGTNMSISVEALPGYRIDRWVLLRTGNYGERIISTNTPAVHTNRAAVTLTNLMGSNLIHSSFSMLWTTHGIPHPWLLAHGLPTTDNVETNNPDGDQSNTLQEWIADTNPTNSDSFFPPLTISSTGGLYRLTIEPTSTARLYRVNCTTNLMNGFDPYTNSMGTGAKLLFPVNTDTPREFYRSSVEIPEE